MKKYLLFIVLLLPFCGIAQWGEPEEVPTVEVLKPDSIFYVKDLAGFIEKEALEVGDSTPQGDIYLLKRMHSLMASREASNVYIAIKEKKRYRVWDISIVGLPVTDAFISGYDTINSKKLLEVHFDYFFMRHGYNPVMNNIISCTRSMMLVDIEKNEIVFGREYGNVSSITYLWDIDGGENSIKTIIEGGIEREVFIHPRGSDTVDIAAFPDERTWLGYYYEVKKNRIEFYEIEGEPEGECFDMPVERKHSKPAFWYEYIPDKRIWEIKMPAGEE